ncbi:membrane protein [Bacteroidia bacterium]|nr:membrane protein [Bacteroidia bacterium]GHV70849.1 membrane protein [Bacteroidia bacterium]
MQFLWKYVDEMVGKGVEMKILGEMFFYAALSSIPLALPLAILLASLMTFGNLGEHLELLAMKSSGISLLRIMKPLIVLSIFISGISFFFQNNILPPANAKLWTIVWSLKEKSPELDIPEGSFCKAIPGYNVYVRQKDPNGLLHGMMIYDYSKGFNELVVIVADSGRIKVSDDKKYLVITLYKGESFENMKTSKSRYKQEQIPYARQTFSARDILISFDSNFNMADESIMQNRDISKNLNELRIFVDSVSIENDSVVNSISPVFIKQVYASTFKQEKSYPSTTQAQADTTYINDFERLFKNKTLDQKLRIFEDAKNKIERLNSDYMMRKSMQEQTLRLIRGHQIEIYKKYALSLACLLFFFIGAPLGAIIRKGGLGLPAVISIFLFVTYYTIDLFGLKLARQGVVPVWQGMWMSSLGLAALGVFLTYKAVNDSVMISPDAWKDALQRLFGKKEVRNYVRKELIMTQPDYLEDIRIIENWDAKANQYLAENKRFPFYISFWKQKFHERELKELLASMEHWIEDLRNSNENLVIGKLMDYPVMAPVRLDFLNKSSVRWTCLILFPLGISIYLLAILRQKHINNDIKTMLKVNEEVRMAIDSCQLINEQ